MLVWQESWTAAGVVALTWIIYIFFARPTQCRVEKSGGGPCGQPVTGLLGTCGFHTGQKWRAVPVLVRDGALALPRLMWPRPVGTPDGPVRRGASRRPLPPAPRPAADARREQMMVVVTIVGVVIAALAFIRDLVAG